jgi:D-sedoheptulose 7-phosphate isomerase
MLIDSYRAEFDKYFSDETIRQQVQQSADAVRNTKGVFFIGNGGSNSICSHMMEDYTLRAGVKAYAFTDPSMITCFANDFGYDHALEKWLESYMEPGDLLFSISSSGESANIINASRWATDNGGTVITLSGFKSDNTLSGLGTVNFKVPVESYGIVECFHHTLLHIILDEVQ